MLCAISKSKLGQLLSSFGMWRDGEHTSPSVSDAEMFPISPLLLSIDAVFTSQDTTSHLLPRVDSSLHSSHATFIFYFCFYFNSHLPSSHLSSSFPTALITHQRRPLSLEWREEKKEKEKPAMSECVGCCSCTATCRTEARDEPLWSRSILL